MLALPDGYFHRAVLVQGELGFDETVAFPESIIANITQCR